MRFGKFFNVINRDHIQQIHNKSKNYDNPEKP